MLREFANDNGLTHRSLFTENSSPQQEQPRQPDMYNIGTDADNMSIVEEFGPPKEQQLSQVDEALQNVAMTQQYNQQDITRAHQQQLEREEEGGSGILRSLGSGALTIGGNVAGNMAQGMDFSSAAFAGFSREALQALSGATMTRIAPPPRPLLDLQALHEMGNLRHMILHKYQICNIYNQQQY